MPEAVRWRLRLRSSPERVYEMLATREGREAFWAESAPEVDGHILFRFPNGAQHRAQVLESLPCRRFSVRYFGGSVCTFELAPGPNGGTDLALTDEGVPEDWWAETHAGWVSVLLALKAAADHGVDLRNHDPKRTWDQGYADN